MLILENYNQFNGTHWETGTVRNFMAQRGFTAPHTGQPYSEAFLLGVSGGIVFGYFTFLYDGYDPQCNILTRNTFDPLDTMLSRLGVIQNLQHTAKADRAVQNLVEILEEGQPAIAWADYFQLPYNAQPEDDGMWGAFPILVFGYDKLNNRVSIADRAQVPLTINTAELAAARGRIKKIKNRLLTLEAPNPDKIASAAHLGICDTIRLFTEKPPKGSSNNFGFKAYQYWADMLRKPKQRQSWEKLFPAGLPMFAGLTSAYNFAFLFGKGLEQDGERGKYADFLDEAAIILDNPILGEAADQFRRAAEAWKAFASVILPDDIEPFGRTRKLMWQKHTLFIEKGDQVFDQIKDINQQLEAIRQSIVGDFPLSQEQVVAQREHMAAAMMAIHDTEKEAVDILKSAL